MNFKKLLRKRNYWLLNSKYKKYMKNNNLEFKFKKNEFQTKITES